MSSSLSHRKAAPKVPWVDIFLYGWHCKRIFVRMALHCTFDRCTHTGRKWQLGSWTHTGSFSHKPTQALTALYPQVLLLDYLAPWLSLRALPSLSLPSLMESLGL